MKITNFLIVLTLLLNAGRSASADNKVLSKCSATVAEMSGLVDGLELPISFRTENPVKTGGEFDVMQYFKVLDHLSMQPGYLLDYVYHYDGMGGYPLLYIRPVDQPPFYTESDLPTGYNRTEYLEFVQTDDSPDSFFQLVVLASMAPKFYLFWHAGYNDTQIVCDKASVRHIVSSLNGDFGYRISIPSWIRAYLLKDIAPSVNIGEQTVQVKLVTFTLWGGFYLKTYTISRTFPHTILDVDEKNLVPYDCGVMF